MDFNEKVEYLELFDQRIISDELAEIRTRIYGVLSKGVHVSTDQECKELFPAMRYVIEEMLDHKIAKKEREERLKHVKTFLHNV